MKDTNITNSNTLPNKVKINLNVLGVLMLNGAGRHVDSTDVVTIDQSGLSQGRVELKE
jgi:hypothetical protein